MTRAKVLTLVLAGGQGGRMEVLTQDRAKPALPYGGVYRLIDFSLSNLHHSELSDVWLVVQFETQSILEVVSNGRPWDLDRTHGGLRIVPPQQESDDAQDDWHQGNAHAIYDLRDQIRAFDPDVLLVLSADHIYKLDYREVIDHHLETGAECTLVSTVVPASQAPNHGTLSVTKAGMVSNFEYKAEKPKSDIAATEIFAYEPKILLDTLDDLAADDGGASLGDFGHQLLPELVKRGGVYDFRLPGYWKDVGRPETFFQSHMDLLRTATNRSIGRRSTELDLDDPQWPILTRDVQRMPARLHASARVEQSMISSGCDIAGRVERSVLSPGVVVEAGAVVRDAVIFPDTIVRAGAVVEFALVDEQVVIGKDAQVGAPPAAKSRKLPTTSELVLIGRGAKITTGAKVARGARVDPGSQVRKNSGA